MKLIDLFQADVEVKNSISYWKKVNLFLHKKSVELQKMDEKDLLNMKKELIDFYDYFFEEVCNEELFFQLINKFDEYPFILKMGNHFKQMEEIMEYDKFYWQLDYEHQGICDLLYKFIIREPYDKVLIFAETNEKVSYSIYTELELEDAIIERIIKGKISKLILQEGVLLVRCLYNGMSAAKKDLLYGFQFFEQNLYLITQKNLQELYTDIENTDFRIANLDEIEEE